MSWLVTGANGMLGTDVCRVLARHGISFTAADRADLDLFDEAAVDEAVSAHDVVVNCAAWTAVDDAETDEQRAYDINTIAPGLLSRAAAEHGRRIVHVSTDYVFDGTADSPYDEDAPTDPATSYGRTKAAGEAVVRAAAPDHHLVVRTAWLYGAHGDCFPRTIARLAREKSASGETVNVVDDQLGQPTWTVDVAELIVRLVRAEVPAGTWHATSSGQTTWFEFARRVVEQAGLSADLVSATDSASFVRPAPRPAYSVLGHDKLHRHGIEPIGPWDERWAAAASEVLGVQQAQ
ncbi:MAG: dTDP-4-dehydrorhamnose reductase [Marmoricola sp.]